MLKVAFHVLMFVGISSTAWAQQPQIPPIQSQPTVDSPFGERNPNGPPELAQFDFVIGDWEADVIIRRPAGDLSFKAHWHNIWIVNGTVIFQEWRGPFTTGAEFRSYDSAAGHWKGYNLYPEMIGWKGNEIVWHQDKGEMVITTQKTTPKGEAIQNEIYFDIGPDDFKIRSEISYDQGKTWEPAAFSMSAHRVSSPE